MQAVLTGTKTNESIDPINCFQNAWRVGIESGSHFASCVVLRKCSFVFPLCSNIDLFKMSPSSGTNKELALMFASSVCSGYGSIKKKSNRLRHDID